jgi:hypothetical protein
MWHNPDMNYIEQLPKERDIWKLDDDKYEYIIGIRLQNLLDDRELQTEENEDKEDDNSSDDSDSLDSASESKSLMCLYIDHIIYTIL